MRWWLLAAAILVVLVASSFIVVKLAFTKGGLWAQQNITTPETASDNYTGDVTVELYHFFRGTRQCAGCIAVGALAEKTANTYFSDELDSGRIVFAHVDVELPENTELILKYGATGSSLWIGTYINGTFHKEQNTNVWYKTGNEQDYLEYLKGVLEKRLSGDLS